MRKVLYARFDTFFMILRNIIKFSGASATPHRLKLNALIIKTEFSHVLRPIITPNL